MNINPFQATLIGGLNLFDPSANLDELSLWQKSSLDLIDHLITHQMIDPQGWQDHSDDITKLSQKPTQLILMLLPLLVYFHDDLQTLRQHLDHLIQKQELSPEIQESLYLISEAIAASLRRQLNPNTLLTQLRENHPAFTLSSYLITLQESLEKGISINQLKNKLLILKNPELTSMTLAFFCFCDTPSMPHLSLLRAKQTPLPDVTLSLTGALVGASGGFPYLPHLWRVSLLKNIQKKSIFHKINLLWQKWSGNMTNNSEEHFLTSVSTPLVMQSRPSLRLISHKEYLRFPAISDDTQ